MLNWHSLRSAAHRRGVAVCGACLPIIGKEARCQSLLRQQSGNPLWASESLSRNLWIHLYVAYSLVSFTYWTTRAAQLLFECRSRPFPPLPLTSSCSLLSSGTGEAGLNYEEGVDCDTDAQRGNGVSVLRLDGARLRPSCHILRQWELLQTICCCCPPNSPGRRDK